MLTEWLKCRPIRFYCLSHAITPNYAIDPARKIKQVEHYLTLVGHKVLTERVNLRVYATIVLTVVSDLCPATPDDFSSCSDQSQLRNIYFNDRTFGEDTELGVYEKLATCIER